ncbi:MAG: polysaccharide deacetylase family protein [Ignavibacteriaceae bacterium]
MALNKGYLKGRVNTFLIFFSGLAILCAAVLVYYFVLRGVYGRFDITSLLPTSDTVKKTLIGETDQVAILYSKLTENMLPAGSTWLVDNISTWKRFLGNLNLRYDILSDQDIEQGKHFKYKMLILPGSKSLSDNEIVQIKKYLENGGSVFATGGVASYSEDGKWRGWQFFNQVFGMQFTYEIQNDNSRKVHTLRGGIPLTATIPTGYPLKIATWDIPMAAEVLEPRTTQVSFWYNFRLEEGLVREGVKRSTGIAHGSYGNGRFIWMGFEINSVVGLQEDYILFDRFFNNCVNWLTYSPIAYVKDWPDGYDAAAVLMPILRNEINNIENLLPILRSENIRATFFVDPEKAAENRSLISSLVQYGEVSALVDIGYLTSITDTINTLNDYEVQLDKLTAARSILQEITNTPVTGLFPYYGLFNNNTVVAAINADYNYLLTDSLTDRSVPRTLIRGDKRILAMTKTARDDYEVIRDYGLTLPDFQYYTYQEDLDRILFEGGMYIFKFNTEFQCRDDYVYVIKDVIGDLKKKRFWITTASEIQKWYEKRDFVELRVERRGNNRVALKVSNPGIEVINSLVIDVDLNDDVKNISLDTEIIGTKPAEIIYTQGSRYLFLVIDELKPGESRTYFIDYDRVNV